MTSIPADRTITLGGVVSLEKIRQLQELAELQKPVDLANDRLNNLTMSSYKIEMILTQMTNMKVPQNTLQKLSNELTELKKNTAEAAVDLAEVIIQAEADIRSKKEEHEQTKIGLSIESPISWEDSTIRGDLGISYDSLRFDVQYFSSLESDDRSSASSSQSASSSGSSSKGKLTKTETVRKTTTKYVWSWFSRKKVTTTSTHHKTVDIGTQENQTSQVANSTNTRNDSSRHTEIHGILVLVAECTHKNGDILAPCILDARKTVAAWNYTFPNDKLKTDPGSMIRAAFDEDNVKNKLHLVTGVTKSSSFVGYVELLKEETEKSSSVTNAVASSFASSVKKDLFVGKMSASSNSRSSRNSSSAANLFATSQITNSASLSVMGCIPKITANEHMQVIRGLDPDPSKIMSQLNAVSEASSSATASGSAAIESAANDAGTKATFIELSSQHLQNSVNSMVDKATVQNKIIDINTMMTAFENYVEKCSDGSGAGVPTNYLIKELPKHEVAKVYIRKFYPNGASDPKAALQGQFGQESTGGG